MLGAWLKLHFFSVGKMWCLCSGQGFVPLGTPVLLCLFNKGWKGWPGLPEPHSVGVSLLLHFTSPLACSPKEEIDSREPGAAWAEVMLGVRGSVGTNSPRVMLPRCHHISVFWTRGLPFHVPGFKVLHVS